MNEQTTTQLPETTRPAVTSTIQILSLTEGLYAFSVRGTGSSSAAPDPDLALPSVQVSRAPSSSKGELRVLEAPGLRNGWLSRPGDTIVAQVTGGTCSVLLTSLSVPNRGALSIDIRRLDQAPAPSGEGQPAALQASTPVAAQAVERVLRTQILTHVQNRGDVPFVGSSWAGFIGQRLWIEAFAVTPLEELSPDAIEYKGRTAAGFETPWLSKGAWCGTRGMGVPLIEFAVRLSEPAALRYECEYTGAYFSGTTSGPHRNGVMCRSGTASDPLEAIQVRIIERQTAPPHEQLLATSSMAKS